MILVIIHEACSSTDQVTVIEKTRDLEAAVCKNPGDKLRWRSDSTESHHTASAELYNTNYPRSEPQYITLRNIEFGEIISIGD